MHENGACVVSPIMGLDLRVHLADEAGLPVCGADQEHRAVVSRMVTLHGPAVTCSRCLASAVMASRPSLVAST